MSVIIKRWNGTSYDELYPKTTVGMIVASGTPSSTNWLRGDSTWNAPTASQVGAEPANANIMSHVNATTGNQHGASNLGSLILRGAQPANGTYYALRVQVTAGDPTISYRTAAETRSDISAMPASPSSMQITGSGGSIAFAIGDVSSVNRIQAYSTDPSIRFLNATNGYARLQFRSLLLEAGSTSEAPITLPHGSAPTTPVNGDIWTTTSGIFARINGATRQLDAAGGGSVDVGVPGLNIKPANNLYIGNGTGNTLTTLALAANQITLAPFMTNYDFTTNEMFVSVATAASGISIRLVIYEADANGRPTNILRHGTPVDATTTGTKASGLGTALAMTKGKLYWIGTWASGTVTIRCHQTYNAMPQTWTTAATPVGQNSLRKTVTYHATNSPGNWTYDSGDHNAANAPLVLMTVLA
jgi:hypothetical protein